MKKKLFSIVLIVMVAFGCTPNNVKSDPAIAKILDSAGLQGTCALLENSTELFTIHNLSSYKDSAFAPLNSFFIVPALVGIDKGYITHDSSSWVSMDSTVSYTNLIQKIGRAEIMKAIDSLHYGKGIVSAQLDKFWSDNSLNITADEQLGLIKKLYFNELYFQKRSQEIFKKMILREDNANYKLSYIAAADPSQDNACWITGFVEENKHPFFFVLHTNAKSNTDILNKNVQALKSILTQQGFLKGVR